MKKTLFIKQQTFIVCLLSSIVLFNSCKKKDIPSPNHRNVDIFIGGNLDMGGYLDPYLIKNGELIDFEFEGNERNIYLKSFTIHNRKLHALFGLWVEKNGSKSAYTVNQEIQYIPSTVFDLALKLQIVNNNVYISGVKHFDTIVVLKNWQQIRRQYLNTGPVNSFVITPKEDIYIQSNNRGYYHKNFEQINLNSEGNNIYINHLYVEGDNVYHAGFDFGLEDRVRNAGYWINNVYYPLEDIAISHMAEKIISDNGNIYILTTETENIFYASKAVKYYKNGVPVNIPIKSESYAVDMKVLNNDVYVLISHTNDSGHFGEVYKNGNFLVSYPLTTKMRTENILGLLVVNR